MDAKGVLFRYLGAASYEFVLPDGKHLITDPFYSDDFAKLNGYREFSVDEIEAADYILLSHSHFDHTLDIGKLVENFNAKVFCGSMVVEELSKYFNLHFDYLYPMIDGQTFEFPGFKVTAGHFRHNTPPVVPTRQQMIDRFGNGEMYTGGDEHILMNLWGSLECMEYYVTLGNNLRIMFLAGKCEMENPYNIAREFRPNIVVRQMLGAWEAKDYAHMLHRFGAQLAMPNHQDACMNLHGKQLYTYEELQEKTSEALKELNSPTTFFCPEPYKWYNLNMGIDLVE